MRLLTVLKRQTAVPIRLVRMHRRERSDPLIARMQRAFDRSRRKILKTSSLPNQLKFFDPQSAWNHFGGKMP
jgi:hypothetical protein